MDIDQHDKRVAAAHEAGHLTVALAQGKRACAHIERTGTADPEQEKTWAGQCGLVLSKFTPAIAIAGIVGELLESEGMDTDPVDWMELEEFSPTDAKHIPKDEAGQNQAATTAAKLLREHVEFFRWAIAELIEGEVITDGMGWDRFHGANAQRQARRLERQHETFPPNH